MRAFFTLDYDPNVHRRQGYHHHSSKEQAFLNTALLVFNRHRCFFVLVIIFFPFCSFLSLCCPLLAHCPNCRLRRTGAGCTLLCTAAQSPEEAQTEKMRFRVHLWFIGNTCILYIKLSCKTKSDINCFKCLPLSFSGRSSNDISPHAKCCTPLRTVRAAKATCGSLLWQQQQRRKVSTRRWCSQL